MGGVWDETKQDTEGALCIIIHVKNWRTICRNIFCKICVICYNIIVMNNYYVRMMLAWYIYVCTCVKYINTFRGGRKGVKEAEGEGGRDLQSNPTYMYMWLFFSN